MNIGNFSQTSYYVYNISKMIICPDFRLSGTLSFHPREEVYLAQLLTRVMPKRRS